MKTCISIIYPVFYPVLKNKNRNIDEWRKRSWYDENDKITLNFETSNILFYVYSVTNIYKNNFRKHINQFLLDIVFKLYVKSRRKI